MENIYKYTFVLLPEHSITKLINNLRKEVLSSEELSQKLPPHLTLKRRFEFSEQLSEIQLIDFFDNFEIKKDILKIDQITQFDETTVFTGVGNGIVKKHNEILLFLKQHNISEDIYEGKDFKPHVSIAPGQSDIDFSKLKVTEIIFDKISLYKYTKNTSGIVLKIEELISKSLN